MFRCVEVERVEGYHSGHLAVHSVFEFSYDCEVSSYSYYAVFLIRSSRLWIRIRNWRSTLTKNHQKVSNLIIMILKIHFLWEVPVPIWVKMQEKMAHFHWERVLGTYIFGVESRTFKKSSRIRIPIRILIRIRLQNSEEVGSGSKTNTAVLDQQQCYAEWYYFPSCGS
jgi:hypothetical protein